MPAMDVVHALRRLTGKAFLVFVPSGDHAIKYVLRAIKPSTDTVLVQDQGGWHTYLQFLQKAKMTVNRLPTDAGLIHPEMVPEGRRTALLINSMPAYAYYQDMQPLAAVCKKEGILLINDASGSIGTPQAKIGDIIICSLGRNKPLGIGKGGFIATDNARLFSAIKSQVPEPYNPDETALQHLLDHLPERLRFWSSINERIRQDLKDQDIIHSERKGFNVLLRIHTPEQKAGIEAYCKEHHFPYRIGPEYIRSTEPSISIEVKRLDPVSPNFL